MRSIKLMLVLLFFSLCAMLVGYIIAGVAGVAVFFVMSLLIHAVFIITAPQIILTAARAVRAPKEKFELVYKTLEDICSHMNITTPKLYIEPSPQPNAFVVGVSQKQLYVVVTRGLLEMEEDTEVIAILTQVLNLAKEELVIETIITAYAAVITRAAQMGQFSILRPAKRREKGNSLSALVFFLLAPFASVLLKFVTEKNKQYIADFHAATILREPEILAKGLYRISDSVQKDVPLINPNPSLAHLYVVHPIHNKTIRSLFELHPPLETRVTKLQHMTV